MLIRYIRWAQNLRCPECDTVQPVFGLSSTLRGGFFNVALNDFATCTHCSTRLALVHSHGLGWSLLIQTLLLVMQICVFFAIAAPLFFGGFVVLGLWFLPICLFIAPLSQLIGLLPVRFLGPYCREVITV